MKQEQPDRTNQRSTFFQALRDAAYVLKLRSSSKELIELLIGHIPHDAPGPVSPASVQKLAEALGIEDRAVRYRISKLVDRGLVINRCLANGRRHVQRDRDGIVHIAGIDLSPLLDRAEEWAERAKRKRDDYAHRTRLRFQISEKRGALNRVFRTEEMSARLRELWNALPADIANLSLQELETIVDKVDELLSGVMADRKDCADRPETFDTAYTTDQERSDSCNPAMPAEKRHQEERSRQKPTSGLEHISLRQAVMAAPDDWRTEMDQYGTPSWHLLAGIACNRANALGISPSAWSLAQNAIGPNGAALIVMMADAKSQERGGPVRSVGGWVRRMAERAETGTANLHRTLFGLLHEEAATC